MEGHRGGYLVRTSERRGPPWWLPLSVERKISRRAVLHRWTSNETVALPARCTARDSVTRVFEFRTLDSTGGGSRRSSDSFPSRERGVGSHVRRSIRRRSIRPLLVSSAGCFRGMRAGKHSVLFSITSVLRSVSLLWAHDVHVVEPACSLRHLHLPRWDRKDA